MSDPAKDLDVDDVLSSIRDLVSPAHTVQQDGGKLEALVLTPSFRVDQQDSDFGTGSSLSNLRRALGKDAKPANEEVTEFTFIERGEEGIYPSEDQPEQGFNTEVETSNAEFYTIRPDTEASEGGPEAILGASSRLTPVLDEDEYYEDQTDQPTERVEDMGHQTETTKPSSEAGESPAQKKPITWAEVDTSLIGSDLAALAGLGALNVSSTAQPSSAREQQADAAPAANTAAEQVNGEAAEHPVFSSGRAAYERQAPVTSDIGAEDEILDDEPGNVETGDIPVIKFLHQRRAKSLSGGSSEQNNLSKDAAELARFSMIEGGVSDIAGKGASEPKVVTLAGMNVDEELLREIVVDIVRQELSGTLGEKITRNVRKLVRREIHRALLTRDYD